MPRHVPRRPITEEILKRALRSPAARRRIQVPGDKLIKDSILPIEDIIECALEGWRNCEILTETIEKLVGIGRKEGK